MPACRILLNVDNHIVITRLLSNNEGSLRAHNAGAI